LGLKQKVIDLSLIRRIGGVAIYGDYCWIELIDTYLKNLDALKMSLVALSQATE